MEILFAGDLETAEWSGGTTTQLFIWPRNAAYKQMNFDFRISTATIEVETSKFTQLPGVKRTLMVLEGSLELQHKGHHQTILERFEKDEFSGDWETVSGGMAEDFNLMVLNPKMKGFVRHMQVSKKSKIQFCSTSHHFIYIYRGTILLNDSATLSRGDSIYFSGNDEVNLSGVSNAVIIYVVVE